jgi:hypothetical protein
MIRKGLPEGLMRKMMILMGLLMVGCASKPSTVEPSEHSRQSMYIDKPVSTMVFEHPAMGDAAAGFYDREKLAPGAFVAFEQPEVTVFQIQTDDHLESQDGWMYRRAMTQRVGVSVR